MKKVLLLTSFVALTACSSAKVNDTLHADATAANLKIETARYFSTSQRQVAVGYLKPGVLGTAYKAKVSGRVYDCHYFKKSVSCTRA